MRPRGPGGEAPTPTEDVATPDVATLMPAGYLPPPRRGGALLRSVLPVALVVVMVGASLGTSLWSYRANRAETLKLADELLQSLEARIQVQVRAFLAPAADLARLSRDVLGADALDPARRAETERFAMSALAAHPEVALVTFGTPRGDFLMYARQADGSVHTKHIDRAGEQARVTWTRRAPDGTVVAVEEGPDDGYDPRVRPWYRGAVARGGLHWSDVYVFFTSRRPGLTVSVPVPGEGKRLAAVHGIDITLDSLSRFLDGLALGRRGRALIAGPGHELIAFPDLERLLRADGERLRTAGVDELDEPVLARAFNRFRVEGHGRRVLEVDGERWLNTVSSLEGVLGRPWSVMIVVPEDDFVGIVRRNFRNQLLLDAVVIAVAVVLAGLVVAQGVRARRNARRLEARERAAARERQALGAVATEARLVDASDREALERMTETLAQALEVSRVSVWRLRAGEVLVCEDCYDRRADGHTRGTELHAPVLGGLLEALAGATAAAVTEPGIDPRTRALERAYLEPLGCETLLAAPITWRGQCRGAVWIEDGARGPAWAAETLPFVSGVANLLAPRWGTPGPEEPAARAARPHRRDADAASRASPVPASLGAALRSTTLSGARANAARRRGASGGTLAADLFGTVTVLVVLLDEPAVWAAREAQAGDPVLTRADALVREVEVQAARLGVECLKMLGGQLVCAAGFDVEADAGAAAAASLALAIQAHCTRALGALDNPLAYRMGIDTGPVFGAGLGSGTWTYDLWGEALERARALAATAPPGSIQVSDASYELLGDDHLLATGGHYYVAGAGETSTYLLLGSV